MTPSQPELVIDASVACQLFVLEALTPQAQTLFSFLNTARWAIRVPDLFYAECANIFWKKVQRKVCTPAEASLAMAGTLALPLTPTAASLLATDALHLALTHTISAYDACYVALAQRHQVSLITADQKLVTKLATLTPPVVWLGAWTQPP